jgi:hypothetical protein
VEDEGVAFDAAELLVEHGTAISNVVEPVNAPRAPAPASMGASRS